KAPLPALPMPRGVLQASMISASTMVVPSMNSLTAFAADRALKSIRPACTALDLWPRAPRLWPRSFAAEAASLTINFVYAQLRKTTTCPQGGDMASALRALAGSGLLIASTVLASTVQTQAAEPIHLRVADSFPKGHYLVKLVLEPWMEEVKKR